MPSSATPTPSRLIQPYTLSYTPGLALGEADRLASRDAPSIRDRSRSAGSPGPVDHDRGGTRRTHPGRCTLPAGGHGRAGRYTRRSVRTTERTAPCHDARLAHGSAYPTRSGGSRCIRAMTPRLAEIFAAMVAVVLDADMAPPARRGLQRPTPRKSDDRFRRPDRRPERQPR